MPVNAVEYDQFGPSSVLRVRPVATPTAGPDELLVRVKAASLNPKDILSRQGKFRLFSGLRFPRRVGYDWSGEVVEVGSRVRGIQPGEPRYGMLQPWRAGGTCAELLVVNPAESAPRPATLDHEQAASLPLAALTAWQALTRVVRLSPGQRVLINGASGGVGVFAVQLARHLGATVTTLSSARNLDLCASLGAHHPLDYQQHTSLDSLGPFDLIFDVFGNRPFDLTRRALAPRADHITTLPTPRALLSIARTALSAQRAHLVVVRSRHDDLAALAALVDQGKLRPVIDRVFPLDQIAEAEDLLATRRARGKIVISL